MGNNIRKILTAIIISLLFPVNTNAARIKEFKTGSPELIGTWSFEASAG